MDFFEKVASMQRWVLLVMQNVIWVMIIMLMDPSSVFCGGLEKKEEILSQNGITLKATSPEDMELSVDGIPVLYSPQLYIVSRGWSRKFYAFEDDGLALQRRSTISESGGEKSIVYNLESADKEFSGKLVYTVCPDRRFRVSLEGHLTTSTEAMVEHRFGKFAPGWVIGRQLRAQLQDGRTTQGIAPVKLLSPKISESTLVERYSKLEILSAFGKIMMEGEGNFRYALLDYRMSPYNGGELCYWLGILETKVKSREPFSYSFTIKFPESRVLAPCSRSVTTDSVSLRDCVLTTDEQPDLVLPSPQNVEWGDGCLWFSGVPELVVELDGSSSQTQIRSLVQAILEPEASRYGIKVTWGGDNQSHAGRKVLLRFLSSPGEIAGEQKKHDYYRLCVGKENVDILAYSQEGIRCGLITLCQLFRTSGTQIGIRRCKIEDYSALQFRGVHFFSGKDARDLQLRMIRDVLLPLKYNTVVYQCEYVEWESVPEIHHPRYGMKKSDAQAVVAELRRLGFEVIPLINTFGHCEWLLDNDSYRSLADNPDKPYAYDPSNPLVYELCRKIYSEALQLFQPRIFHIGHDEVTMHGFPQRPANKAVGAAGLFVKDTLYYYEFLKRQGVRTMIWGDLLLAPGEAAGETNAPDKQQAAFMRSQLPKDILIADWHYGDSLPEEHVSLRVLTDAGFDVIASTWYDPLNVIRFARAAYRHNRHHEPVGTTSTTEKEKVLGLLQTTWAGYSFDQESFESNLDQYAAYVLAGESAWRGGAEDLKEIPYDYREAFSRLWSREVLSPTVSGGWTANLNGVANLVLDGSLVFPSIVGDERVSSFGTLGTGEHWLGRILIDVPRLGGKPASCLLAGKFNPQGDWPTTVTIPVGHRADVIIFAVASTVGAPRSQPIALTTITYEDNTTDVIFWRPGVNVFALEDERTAPLCPVLWKNSETGKAPRVLHAFLWKTSFPQKRIIDIKTESTSTGGALMLFGVTGIQGGSRNCNRF
jgi:hypothetical protein